MTSIDAISRSATACGSSAWSRQACSRKVSMFVVMSKLRTGAPSGKPTGLPEPRCELGFVERVVFADVEVADVVLLRLAGRQGAQGRAAEERDLHVLRVAVKAQHPAFALEAVEGRVPLHRLAHVGNRARDEFVEAAADVSFPVRHRID